MTELTRRGFIGGGLSLAALGGCVSDRLSVECLPRWKPGDLDIHFIQTGVGEQTFFIFPDGTTMLLDCGDMYRPKYLKHIPRSPSAERLGGEWVSRYVQRLVPQRRIDYFVLSHWHGDHCGKPTLRSEKTADGRTVCGVTRFAEDFDIGHYFDHQFPRAGVYAQDPDRDSLEMMRKWIPFMERRCGMKAHSFEVGAINQIRMLGDRADEFRNVFSIRNLHANCRYWDGRGTVVDYAPTYIRRNPKENGTIAENSLSLGFRLDYGRFSAYFGGDIDYPDYENRLAEVIGPVDVFKSNHHACPSSMGRKICAALKARVYLTSIWSPNQVTEKNLVNMSSRELYSGDRYICPGFVPDIRRNEYEGRDFMRDFLPVQGHTVIKVTDRGLHWGFYVLTAQDESMRVLHTQQMA